MNFEDYAINVSPLPSEDGGGSMASIPDLPGCIADGATIDEAIAEARDAFNAWTTAEREDQGSLPQPKPTAANSCSGFRRRSTCGWPAERQARASA